MPCFVLTVFISEREKIMAKEIKNEFRLIEEQIRKIQFYVTLRGRDIILSYGLTPSQFSALEIIYQKNGITPGELTRKLGYALSSTTDVLKKLNKFEMITRDKDLSDKRVHRCFITEKGKEMIEFVYFRQADYYFGLCRDFRESEVYTFLDMLNRMADRIDEAIL